MSRLFIGLLLLVSLPAFVSAYSVSTNARIVAFGDVHGAYDELVSVLRKTNVIDEDNRWIGGNTQLVSVGDILDRGPDSRKALDLLIRLETEADLAGGRLHFVLGNHEVLILTNDYKYVSDAEFAAFAVDDPAGSASARLKPGELAMREAFSRQGRYGKWLMDKPVLVKINSTLFMHAGLSSQLLDLSLDEINRDNKKALNTYLDTFEELVENDYLDYTDSFNDRLIKTADIANGKVRANRYYQALATDFFKSSRSMLFSDSGPTWYRGSARCHPYTEYDTLSAIFANLGAERLVIGHTPTFNRQINSRFDERVFSIDTGMLTSVYRGRPAALIIEGDQTSVVYADADNQNGNPISAFKPANRLWNYPKGLDEKDVEEFLRNAPVSQIEPLGEGITKPFKVTLEQNGIRMNAVFKYLDTDPQITHGRWNRLYDKADRYQHDIAAYKLDRALGFDMVPVAVARSVNGNNGVLQYWIPGSINEKNRREQSIEIRNADCPRDPQLALMNTFDRLIANDDRNLSNILYTEDDWNVWMIDHTRAFRSGKRFPRYLEKDDFLLPGLLRQRLQSLNENQLPELLGNELHQQQIRGILRRAERLLSDD